MKRRTEVFYKAGAIGDQVIPDLVIEIRLPVELMEQEIGTMQTNRTADDGPSWQQKWRNFYDNEGRNLASALKTSLPGGTFNALLIHMLDLQRSIFSVPMFDREEHNEVVQNSMQREELLQQGFDLLASLIEDVNNRGDFPGTPVWDAAGKFCDKLRDQGMEREMYADYYGVPEAELEGLVDVDKLPFQTGICATCADRKACPLKETLRQHRELQKQYGTEDYEQADPMGWDMFAIDEPTPDIDEQGGLCWCPLYCEETDDV